MQHRSAKVSVGAALVAEVALALGAGPVDGARTGRSTRSGRWAGNQIREEEDEEFLSHPIRILWA